MKHTIKLRVTLLIGLLVFLLVGCAAGGDVEPNAASGASGDRQATSVPDRADADNRAESDDASEQIPEENMVEPADENQEPIGEAGTDDAQSGSVSPVEVDISKITPAPAGEDGEAVEMPQPGVPDPVKAMISKATSELARLLDIDVAQISLVSAEAVQWRDASLGCPQPGMNYLSVITPGFRIVLESEGETYQYHTDSARRVVLCDPDDSQPPFGLPNQ